MAKCFDYYSGKFYWLPIKRVGWLTASQNIEFELNCMSSLFHGSAHSAQDKLDLGLVKKRTYIYRYIKSTMSLNHVSVIFVILCWNPKILFCFYILQVNQAYHDNNKEHQGSESKKNSKYMLIYLIWIFFPCYFVVVFIIFFSLWQKDTSS